mmetsp:Transcript_29797/g.63411  ORF Transcript_29797/g.63411 Transcript_29797/m.63411 type:complete len:248 (-) Transcript_29797:2507-3250(-)
MHGLWLQPAHRKLEARGLLGALRGEVDPPRIRLGELPHRATVAGFGEQLFEIEVRCGRTSACQRLLTLRCREIFDDAARALTHLQALCVELRLAESALAGLKDIRGSVLVGGEIDHVVNAGREVLVACRQVADGPLHPSDRRLALRESDVDRHREFGHGRHKTLLQRGLRPIGPAHAVRDAQAPLHDHAEDHPELAKVSGLVSAAAVARTRSPGAQIRLRRPGLLLNARQARRVLAPPGQGLIHVLH